MISADDDLKSAVLVVGGDFNAAPDSDEIRMLVGKSPCSQPGFVLFDAWDWSEDRAGGATWSRTNPWAAPSLLPDQRIDYVFVGWPRRGGVGSVLSSRLACVDPFDGLMASDHYGVVADLRY